MKIYKTYNIKKLYLILFFIITLLILFIFSKENFFSAKNTVNMFFFSVMPSLFPFILFTEIILKTNIIDILSQICGSLFSKIFKIDNNCASCIIIGFLCGFPMGAKSVISTLENGKINYTDAKKLLCFINNCNPIFVLSTIAINIFGSIKIGIILLLSHIISAIILGVIYSRYINNNIIHENSAFLKSFSKKSSINSTNYDNYSFFEIIKTSILNTFITLEIILGFMIIFNILSNIFVTIAYKINFSNNIIQMITAIFEVTGGCYNIGKLNIDITNKILIISFMLGFSGLCIIFQIYSVIYKYNFKITNLIKNKFFHGITSILITYIILKIIKIDDIKSITSFSNTDMYINTISYNNLLLSYLVQIIGILSFLFLCYKFKRK